MSGEKTPLLASSNTSKYVLVIHGGAGTMSPDGASAERQAMYRAALSGALKAGYAVLKEGGEAMDSATAAVSFMENCPLFNSGKGAVFNVAGKNELEASLMLSKPPSTHPEIPASRRGMALTLLGRSRNPSQLARAFYLAPETCPHALLSGQPAEDLAVSSFGHKLVDPAYFYTEARWREHRRGLGLPEEPLPHDPEKDSSEESLNQLPKGTVGAVALDIRGCIAAVTSTGGRTNKLVGRVGDTPMSGCGFWAEEWLPSGWVEKTWDRVCGRTHRAVGISGTGDGDYFIRLATAATIAHRVKFLGESLDTAAQHGVDYLRRDGGDGGVIGLDQDGTVVMHLNCPGMYRGFIQEDGVPKTAIFADDVPS